MQKTTSEKLKLGIFVIVALLLFVGAVYLIGNRQNMFAKTFSISANFNNVNGLLKGNNVRYSGINIGTVNAISMINDSTINVNMVIDKKMVKHIKKDAIATIGTDGLVGNMIVNIIPGKGNAATISAGDIIKSFTKIGTDDMLNTLNVTNENAALLTAELLEITNAITSGKGTLAMLINDSITANNIKQAINNLQLASVETRKTIKGINGIVNSIDLNESVAGVLLNDPFEAEKMRQTIANLNASSESINKLIANLDKTIGNIKDGKGALNYLSNDEEFVKNLKETLINLNQGTDKFNQNMEALKHNFLTRSYFRKLEREKKKALKDNN
ncbi:MlaD family protein [Gelatiniphilus marinus]|uniref:MlaD family protein n=1 Tax=Gelatiniphilus marinus TaxID=1759464 RepID=A0ABW5JPX9_9FLAO